MRIIHLVSNRFLLTTCFILIASCGGGGGSNTANGTNTSQTGFFIDAAVEGVRHESPSHSGLTDASGAFLYQVGEVVSFYIGDILLGSATGQAQLTPLDFVPGAVDASNQQVTNILRFLQTLDADDNPANGIEIPSIVSTLATGQSLDFTLSSANFEAAANIMLDFLTSGVTTTLIDANDAITHFQTSTGIGGTSGGETPGEGTYGGLTLSGTDSAGTGTSFNTSIATAFVGSGAGAISWAATPGAGLTVSISSAEITSVIFVKAVGTNEVYSYNLACNLAGADCSGLTLDLVAQSLSFVDVIIAPGVVAPGQTNLASAPLTFNGTVTWD